MFSVNALNGGAVFYQGGARQTPQVISALGHYISTPGMPTYAVGDLVVAVANTPLPALAAPHWSLLGATLNGRQIIYRFMDGSANDTAGSVSAYFTKLASSFRNVDPSSPIIAVSPVVYASGSRSLASINADTENSLLVIFSIGFVDTGSGGLVTGLTNANGLAFTNRVNLSSSSGSGGQAFSADAPMSFIGASGASTFTSTATHSAQFLLRGKPL